MQTFMASSTKAFMGQVHYLPIGVIVFGKMQACKPLLMNINVTYNDIVLVCLGATTTLKKQKKHKNVEESSIVEPKY